MLNWNTVPMTFNDAWTYLEMLGKLVTVVSRHDSDIEALKSDVSTIKIQITQIIEGISDIRDMVTDLAGDVNDLENRVETLEAEVADIGNIVEVGQCGENAFYALYSDGRVLIKGTGDLYNYTSESPSPFYNSDAVTKVIITSGITSVGDLMFKLCENLELATLPNTITKIGERAFIQDTNDYTAEGKLTNIVIPNAVTEIGYGAFWSTALTSVTVPSNVATVGSYIFSDCTDLETAHIECSQVGENMFSGCYSLRNVVLSSNVTEIGESAFTYCTRTLTDFGLETITYDGTLAMWEDVTKGTGWDGKAYSAGSITSTPTLKRIQCSDGAMVFDENIGDYGEWVVESDE